jgi:hypothetical protein
MLSDPNLCRVETLFARVHRSSGDDFFACATNLVVVSCRCSPSPVTRHWFVGRFASTGNKVATPLKEDELPTPGSLL